MSLVYALLFLLAATIPAVSQKRLNLPDNVKNDDVVEHKTIALRGGKSRIVKITVRQRLKVLGARNLRTRLVDRNGREIRFYFLQGCWGNPPADYLEILERQRKEIADLQKRFTVIEMTCNPTGVSPLSIS